MNYFVSIENTIYYHWQIELLIESFKIHNLQNNLYIFIADGDYKDIPENCKNLIKHKNVYKRSNSGSKTNELVALYQYIDEEIVDYPYVFIQPSMILKNPVDKYNKNCDIVVNSYYENNRADEFLSKINANIKFNFSTPIIFNKIDKSFYNKLLENLQYALDNTDVDFPCDLLAWKMSLLEHYDKCSMVSNILSCTLLHNNVDAPFINYDHGVPNEFNKRFFIYSDPYDVLLNLNVSDSCVYLQNVLNSYLKH